MLGLGNRQRDTPKGCIRAPLAIREEAVQQTLQMGPSFGKSRNLAFPCTLAHNTIIKDARGRHIHHAQHRAALFHQCHVHRELTILLDKFLGAIQGVHHPESFP